jgi:(1->4)-alpha-D-glucan 1-alpha-D-glucosylmutase
MAKGEEDTAFYRHLPLISLNEVGGDPGRFGGSPEDFHRAMADAARHWPEAMLTLSTHDTKRSGDVRARISVLSELPEQWESAVARWSDRNEPHKRDIWPDRNAEYLLYQTLVGAWPIGEGRAAAFMQKAAKEAKVHTSWVDPNADYDDALAAFVTAVLADRDFVADLEGFLAEHRIVERGRVNSLAQTALLLTCPGIPDLYQGTELWDLSLVDPDNRRPVDYSRRRALLEGLVHAGPEQALARAEEGGPKLWLIHRVLGHRRRHPQAYGPGSGYEPLDVRGPGARHAVAFERTGGLAVIVPRLAADPGTGEPEGRGAAWGEERRWRRATKERATREGGASKAPGRRAGKHSEPEGQGAPRRRAGDTAWPGTTVELPGGGWVDVLTGEGVGGGSVSVADLLERFPVAVLGRER